MAQLVYEREAFVKSFADYTDAWAVARIIKELQSAMSRDDAMELLPEVIAEEILTRAELLRVGRNVVDVIRINGSSFSMLREEPFDAQVVPEGAEIPIATTSYEKINVTPYKIGIRPHLTREMIADAQWDVMRRQIRAATNAMTRKEDVDIISMLEAMVPDGTTIKGYRVDDHIIEAADWGGSSGDPLSIDGMAQAFYILDQEEIKPDVALINPVQKKDLFTMGEFRSSGIFQAAPRRVDEIIANGWVANWYGLNWYVSNRVTAGKVLIFDSSRYAALFERTPLTIEDYRDVIRQMEGTAFSQRYVPAAIVNEACVQLIELTGT